ncbi:Arc/MetJ family transcription regulator [Arcanobacterium wilhelmae]|uniref:Arc/MetJ family transcription regulator n=1 Tax=Arcanobacterium wilhelmae TaxID=1803177 RepID=A0ABT9NBG8_9ACTO|nr:type II toxin-antitoxin system VapB family antitoxin [Arcanobacterium wilhelmae]MDP9800868.1 Arc/MetJ family transcription regulator [Arcanobacterium wilhelmae]WFN90236.1 type II toxin-antitoxin system VapB family antitoxin [Arcanobacterium wilhelmae]
MKTLIDIDEKVLQQVMEMTGAPTKKAAVNEVLANYVRQQNMLRYIDLLKTGILKDLDDPEVIREAQR